MKYNKYNINRRESIKTLSLITGYAFAIGASSAFVSGCTADESATWVPSALTSDQLALIEVATERILPKTDTPGANDALVHRYIDEALANVYKQEDKDRFISNLDQFDELAREKYKKKFVELKVDKMDDILTILAKEWKDGTNSEGTPIFKELRDLTLTGFATSEVGAKEFFIYDPIPGPYKGCIPLSEVGGTYAL